MKCQACGRTITKAYRWNGQALGSGCYRKLNPYHTDPAQAVYLAAEALLGGNHNLLSSLPGGWARKLTNRTIQREADARRQIHGFSSGYWLALLARNSMARSGANVFPITNLEKFR